MKNSGDKRKKYKEGSLIGVPLSPNGYCIGLITRINDSIILGVFAKKKFPNIPSVEEASIMFSTGNLDLTIQRFGSLALDKGLWVVLGTLSNWSRNEWPVPVFKRKIDLTNKYFVVYYDEDLEHAKEVVTDYEPYLDDLSNDSTAGYASLEYKLSKLLQ